MIYILRRIDKDDGKFDVYNAKVVRANNPHEARRLANRKVGDEGHIWTDSTMTTCRTVNPVGDNMIVITDFNAG